MALEIKELWLSGRVRETGSLAYGSMQGGLKESSWFEVLGWGAVSMPGAKFAAVENARPPSSEERAFSLEGGWPALSAVEGPQPPPGSAISLGGEPEEGMDLRTGEV
jgi:hypothetical protein